ncbi:putative multi-sensor signal transduction histidine kinase [Actinoplanes missouriensis 431]|uniref:histidine kinase n=1 Tax=Actinoplanes missouriensis (strain ATCC 14538 / DSM 43046 / CBS 188.64 / JCM 3121 / NBRC 102363 / NCIMB 12654 / NRRL B-3342 / UNCC 431) TaxID=512565 RepID=I0H905_ACTM4|nr:ATP-binding protein [Actinoplanes missouriensis]BAL89492.1 putative multi-sensor signal transduction histidine kinase [Actinoplanes missouriensis 431]
MVTENDAVLRDPVRLAAVEQARLLLPVSPAPADGVARLAARLLHTPMAAVTLVGAEEEHFAGVHELPASLAGTGHASLSYSVCKYIVSADQPVSSGDMLAESARELRGHPLVTEYGVRAFAGVPVRDAEDRPVGSLTVLDVAPREWTAEHMDTLTEAAALVRPVAPAKLDAAALLTVLLDSLSVGVIVADEHARIVVMNRALREVVGLSPYAPVPDDLPAHVGGMLHRPDLTPLHWEETPLMRALGGEQVGVSDVLTVRPGHRIRTFAATANPIVGTGGRRLGALSVAHEVTALRRAEKFRDCHRRVEVVLRTAESAEDAAPEILEPVVTTLGWPCAELFLIDDAHGDLRSVGHYDATGADPGDGLFGHVPAYGHGITGRVWETGQPLWVPDIADTAAYIPRPAERARIDICLRRGIRTVLAVPVRDGGTMLGVLTCYAGTPEVQEDLLTVLLDGVASQIGVYVALRRAEQLARQLSRAQNDFIDLVGHEMRTPLTSITTNAGVLAEEAGGLDDEQQQMIQSISRNSAALQRIIDTLLDLAGLDSGHLGLRLTEIDLAALVTDAVQTARASTALDIDLWVPPAVGVRGDADRLRQVITDLLSNAATYSPPGGHVVVTLTAGAQTAELSIADSGIGMPAEERERVFDRFFRGSNVRHQGIPGSGLGLSLARTIVALHGGTIRLDANEPAGTIVRVRLPKA